MVGEGVYTSESGRLMGSSRLSGLVRCLCDGGRMMVGVPNYDVYVQHLKERHPDREPMNPIEFTRDRQAARFGEGGRGGFRCC
jgi:uncharacterized short protein YbdD (DUF466 family)